MAEFRVVGDGARPPLWRTLLVGVVAAFTTMMSIVFSPIGYSTQDSARNSLFHSLVGLGSMVVGLVLIVGLGWRHRRPFALLAASCVAALLLPIGNTLPLVALVALIGRRAGPAVTLATVGAGLTTAWVTVGDFFAQPRGASVLKEVMGPASSDPNARLDLPGGVLPLALIGSLALAVALGLLVRSRREVHTVQQASRAQQETTDRLGAEIARRQERERIAREVHDAMGHRLSLLSLHAGALELHARGNPELAESARLVRQSATEALEDLRSLLAVLREPLGAEPPDLPLTRLAEVVQDAFGAGQPLSSTIFIEDAAGASPALSRAVYRIVQELLTNVRKHAPGQTAFLSVQGGPATGVSIDAHNLVMPGDGAGATGDSRGLAGLTERAELLGGQVRHGLDPDGRTFRVSVQLPWAPPTPR